MRAIALSALLLLAGCATAPVVDAPTALDGRELDTALNLFGRYDERVQLDGKPYYVWRRAVILSGQTYYCELRAEVGYRNIIRASVVEGYPAACNLFAVQYTAMPERRTAPAPAAAPPTTIAKSRPPAKPQETASASGSARDASARPR
ncbi:hypothetical protein [Phenylobacterium sp.]|jgi:hypothetical protein|uniref:hypothetical protein n=1 Tax=Phenylobacterium sp. TaxID=1871053 RepID=UPI002F94E5F0